MMLHQDGSTHEWVPGCQWDLIVTLDNVTTEIYSAFFVDEEGTLSRLRGLREVIGAKGLFSSLYADRGSHYWPAEEAEAQLSLLAVNLTPHRLVPAANNYSLSRDQIISYTDCRERHRASAESL